MFNPTSVLADTFGTYLSELYLRHFSRRNEEYASYIGGAARLILERIGNSDALYHNTEHTIMVTLVGQQILRGRLLNEALKPDDWLHYTLALLLHDIGYCRGICRGDRDGAIVVDHDGRTIMPPRGSSDAALAPYHVDRGLIYVRERFLASEIVDAERIVRAIDYTRFPVPQDPYYAETDGEAALVRSADLIGQMGDPFYHRKINGLFQEFSETGTARQLGYDSPIDLVDQYPKFFWSEVQPYLGPALRHLEATIEGKQWVAHLYNHVFQAELKASNLGPFPGVEPSRH